MDLLLFGGAATLYQADALEDFTASAESDVAVVMQTRVVLPAGPDGEAVLRRLYIEGYHTGDVAFYVAPIVDGEEITPMRAYFSRPSTSTPRRFAFMAGLGRMDPSRPSVLTGLIGTGVQVRLEATDPTSQWQVETLTIAHRPKHTARGKDSVA